MQLDVHSFDERWKYTSLRSLESLQYHVFSNNEKANIERSPVFSEIVFVNGLYCSEYSSLPQNITCKTLDPIEGIQGETKHRLSDWNRAHLTSGVQIEIGSQANSLTLRYILTQAAQKSRLHIRNKIRILKNACVNLTVIYEGGGSDALFNPMSFIELEEGATLNLCWLQEQASTVTHLESLAFSQQKDSCVNIHALGLGSELSRLEVSADYQHEQAQCHVNAVYFASGSQKMDFYFEATHATPHCKTTQHARGCAKDRAKAIYQGTVIVQPEGKYSVSEQSHHGLLLSPLAQIYAKPALEIQCDEVNCRHGATVGQLSEDALFYLQSRGMDFDSACALLQMAHVSSLLDSINDDVIKTKFKTKLLQKMAPESLEVL